MPSVGDLFVSLGFEVDSKALDEFTKGIKGLSSNMLELLGIAGVSAYGVNKFVTGAMDGAQSMNNLAQGTRLAVDQLQKYAAVTSDLNPKISVDAAAGAIAGFDDKLNAIRLGGGDASLKEALGRAEVAVNNQNAIQVLDELRNNFKNIDPTLQKFILSQAGLPKEFMNVLSATPEQFKNIGDKVGLTSNELLTLAESSRKLNDLFLRLNTQLEKLLAWLLTPEKAKPYTIKDFNSGIHDEWEEFIHKDIPDYLKNKSSHLWTWNNTNDLFSNLEKKNNLTPGLLSAVMKQESGGNPNAVSPAGAQGAFQFMPATAKQFGINPFDLKQSAEAAAKYLHYLQNKFGSTDLALAAYNWGEGNLSRKGIGAAPKETRDYVNNISVTVHSNQKPQDLAHAIKQSYQNAIFQNNNAAVA